MAADRWAINTARRTLRIVRQVRGFTVVAADARNGTWYSHLARIATGRRPHLAAYWSPYVNFGDALAPDILEFVTGLRPRFVSAQTRGKVLSVGSILRRAQPGDTVWGTGAMFPGRADLTRATVLAVRGPRTRSQIVGDCPEVYGDPAIILPLIYQPRPLKRVDIGLIPHVVDQDVMRSIDPRVNVIDLATTKWRSVVDEICRCEVVLSSSLHGLIVAEAYGIPAVWVKASDRVLGDGFKFHDYYESTGREIEGSRPWSAGVAQLVAAALEPPPLDATKLLSAWFGDEDH